MRHQRERLIGAEFSHLVRARGDGAARPFEPGVGLLIAPLANDIAACARKTALQRHIGSGVVEAHRHPVHRLDALQRRPGTACDGGHLRRQFLARARCGHALTDRDGAALRRGQRGAEHTFTAEGEHHILGGHLVAIVEPHARAQRQFNNGIGDAAPAGGEAGLRCQVAQPVSPDERLPHGREEYPLTHVGLFAQRLQRVGVADLLHRDGDGGPVIGLPKGRGGQGGKRRGQQGAAGDHLETPRSCRPPGAARKPVSVRSAWRSRQDSARWA